jgi:uncharacterized membrane protein
MLEAHTLDAWTRLEDRSSQTFAYVTILGGFGAPLFLWLAGVVLVLSADRSLARTADHRRAALAIVKRGIEISSSPFSFDSTRASSAGAAHR